MWGIAFFVLQVLGASFAPPPQKPAPSHIKCLKLDLQTDRFVETHSFAYLCVFEAHLLDVRTSFGW